MHTNTLIQHIYTYIHSCSPKSSHRETLSTTFSSCSILWLSKMKVRSRNVSKQVSNVNPSSSHFQTSNLPKSCAWVPVSPVAANGYMSPEIIDPLQLLLQTPLCTPVHALWVHPVTWIRHTVHLVGYGT